MGPRSASTPYDCDLQYDRTILREDNYIIQELFPGDGVTGVEAKRQTRAHGPFTLVFRTMEPGKGTGVQYKALSVRILGVYLR